MSSALTIRIDEELDELLTRVAEGSGLSRSEVARQALRRQLRVALLDRVRERLIPYAEAQGLLTDEDVFDEVS
jgi:predicted transcriptional regulator